MAFFLALTAVAALFLVFFLVLHFSVVKQGRKKLLYLFKRRKAETNPLTPAPRPGSHSTEEDSGLLPVTGAGLGKHGGYQTEAALSPRGHMTTSGDSLVAHAGRWGWGGGATGIWWSVTLLKPLRSTGQPHGRVTQPQMPRVPRGRRLVTAERGPRAPETCTLRVLQPGVAVCVRVRA